MGVYAVSVIGFNATERIMLGSIFNLSMRRNPNYRQVESNEQPDLLLVDGGNQGFVDEAMNVINRQPAAVLLIAENDLDTGWHSLPRPLHWARLFKSMDLALGFLTHGLASRQPGARPAPPRYELPAELTGIRAPHGGSSSQAHGAAPRARSVPRSMAQGQAQAAAPASGERILYASSSAKAGDAVSQAIGLTGAQVDIVQSGERVLEVMEQARYSCLFIDAALPGIDGYQLCRLVKTKPPRDLPVVLFKANASAFERVRASMAGCDAFFSTPADEEDIRSIALRLMPRAKRSNSAGAMTHA
jgi:two-component system cell cycle response regulator